MGMLSILWIVFLGWMAGGVVNYGSDVLPRYRSFTTPNCTQCGESLPFYTALIPVICPVCGKRPSKRTWIVFSAGVILSIVLWYIPPVRLGYYGGLLWLTFFGMVVVIDIEHRLILHPVSIVGAVLGLTHGVILHGFRQTLLGGAFGFLVMLFFYYAGIFFVNAMARIRDIETDEVALGFGDVNLAGIIGLLLGWPGITAGLVIAILLGGLVSGLYLGLRFLGGKYTAFEALPYGPFLVLSTVYLLYIA